MYCLKELNFEDYYYLDNDKIYNSNKKTYVKEVANYRYKLKTINGNYKSITIKEIYRKLFNKVFCIDNISLLENEVFKEIKGTNGNYEVSNKGRIKSKASNWAIILKPQITKNGYERLQIYIDGHKYSKLVHCLVAETWLNKPNRIDIDIHHKDFNKLNNELNNLEYLTKAEHIKKHKERII